MATNHQAVIDSPVHQPSLSLLARPVRMVVVDDSPEFLEVACGLINTENFIEIVGKGTDGTQAVHAASDLQPDILLMDVQMPYMNGLTAALLVSQHFPATKVVLMSAEDSLQTRISCRSSGAHAFIHKPAFRA
jgi:two-component system, NarL family, nitrate/nitrite response regulator NarL